jgi:hypothetical protein
MIEKQNGRSTKKLNIPKVHHKHVSGELNASGGIELWITRPYAPSWFEEAQNEAKKKNDPKAIPREIIFAVCFAESYLVEWALNEVFNKELDEFNNYPLIRYKFPGIADRWKKVVKDLCENELNVNPPDFGKSYWGDWLKLIGFRSGIVHGASSFPEKSPLPKKKKPRPSPSELSNTKPGWATKVVIELVKELHEAVGTKTPHWLRKP